MSGRQRRKERVKADSNPAVVPVEPESPPTCDKRKPPVKRPAVLQGSTTPSGESPIRARRRAGVIEFGGSIPSLPFPMARPLRRAESAHCLSRSSALPRRTRTSSAHQRAQGRLEREDGADVRRSDTGASERGVADGGISSCLRDHRQPRPRGPCCEAARFP